jgi:hypothetical protein
MKPSGLAHKLDVDAEFHRYAEQIMCTFSVGIKKLQVIKKPIQAFFGDDNKDEMETLMQKLAESSSGILKSLLLYKKKILS